MTIFIQSALGLIVLTGLAWALGENRGRLSLASRLRIAGAGLAMQLVLAALLLKLPVVAGVFAWLSDGVVALQSATEAGTSFVFGYLGGGPLPFEEHQPGANFVFAFRVLPLVLVMSALSSLLFYWRVLPVIVHAFSWCLRRSLGIGGVAGVGAAANVFVGMVEAPLLIRPYLREISRGELFIVMTCGMATIAGTMLVLYATVLSGVIPDAAGHLLTASIISAPAAITVARLMVPDTDSATDSVTAGVMPATERPSSAMDAITRGTLDGTVLLFNIVAMLVVLVALVHLVNQVLGVLPDIFGEAITLQRLLGYVMAPVAWLMGVPWAEIKVAGALLGTKIVLNEFIAYLDLVALPGGSLSERSRLIMTYALCGFANFGSLGIMVGGLATMVPERRGEIVALGMRSIVAGTIATSMTGAIVGLLGP